MEVTQEEYQKVVDQLNQLQEEYDQLNMMFENMGQGYEEALKLYDQAMESSRMKTDFIQQISHEIRTPLNILSGFTQILTTPGMELDEATQKEVSQGIADNTNRITNLVNKMLELADAGSDQEIERNDDVPAVQIAAQAADESRITMATHLAFDIQMDDGTDMAMLHTNLQQATRALVLLLDNAMKFTRPAEAALATAEAVTDKKVLLKLTMVEDGTMMAFAVEDNGIGVPPEEAERIFDEFVQLDEYYDGTGIGLTVARSIARRLGGNIVLDTDYTGGARFVYTLPM
ncbi:MAG: HAMP domain-containing histidine kinase [Prevotella sp.]|nr:HAMP domain-containing histidine kinase [Prevotella sp.]MBR6319772.1 HAMP domain-containing histidine kinase [Prevotella sp.]